MLFCNGDIFILIYIFCLSQDGLIAEHQTLKSENGSTKNQFAAEFKKKRYVTC